MIKDNILVFDLDGTLYQDMDFHRNYLKYIIEDSCWVYRQKELIELADHILEGHKDIPMHCFYYKPQENFKAENLRQLENGIIQSLNYELSPLQAYENNNNNTIFAGDSWAVAEIVAAFMGKERIDTASAFDKIRKEMLLKIKPDKHIRNKLMDLKNQYTTILFSNSPPDTAGEFIKALGLDQCFHYIFFNANKPWGVESLLTQENINPLPENHHITVFGDHYFNDFLPFCHLKANYIWLNPYISKKTYPHHKTLSSYTQLYSYLEAFE